MVAPWAQRPGIRPYPPAALWTWAASPLPSSDMSFGALHRPPSQREGSGMRAPSPARLFVLSFAGLILAGTLGYLVLPGMYAGDPLSWVDALFMITSAVCVTGLSVVDPGTFFTPFGQFWLLLFIQLGGLGILSLTSLAVARLGKASMSLEEAGGGGPVPLRYVDERALLRTVVAMTLAVEAVGATALWATWRGPMGGMGAIWPAVFHAISAFCNAGFSLFPDNLASLRTSPMTLGVVGGLIVLGGLGFVVMEDLRSRIRGRAPRLSVHTRLVRVSTTALLAAGWIYFLAFEWSNQLADLPVLHKATNALFMSVTPRTAGFNTVDYGQVSNPTFFFTILLMLVGGSPGGTAGGLKTTTGVVLMLALLTRLRGGTDVTAFQRSLPRETVGRAASLAVGGLVFLAALVLLLLMTESGNGGYVDRASFMGLVFEAHSAFGTVGLSTGITPAISPAGKLVLVVLMFAGRVGPAVLIASMISAAGRRRQAYRLGREDVMIG
ncbi:MAG: potassium transporter TrkH [Gemmatimonadetes bacterium]|nr:potassium transporter TrkH [Gemmatimonadota bacterium]